MAVRTVTVDLRLDAGSYLAIARSVVRANNAIDSSFNDLGASAAAAGSAANYAGRDLQQMGNRARLAERRVHNLREEIDRLVAAQAAMRAGGPIPPIVGGAAGGGGGPGGVMSLLGSPAGAGILGGVALAGPFIGSALGAAILTGIGSAGIGAGIAASVANDEQVRQSFTKFGQFVKEEFVSYGQAFDVPLINAAERFHDRFASISPKVRRTLAEMAVAVEPLADGLADFVEKAGPGVAAGLRASIPVLLRLAHELGGLGEAAGDFFRLVGAGSEGAADGMTALVRVAEGGLYTLGGWILYLEKILSFYDRLPSWAKGIGGTLLTGGEEKKPEREAPMGPTYTAFGDSADYAAKAVERLTGNLWKLTDGFNSQFGAAIAYEEALDGLSESVKENGSSMDISSAKGRDNARALMAVFAAAEATYEANIRSGMSAQEAARKYNEQIEKARQTALAAGMAAAQVNALAAAQRNLPTGKTIVNTVITRFRTEGGPNYNRTPGNQIAQRDGGIVYARDGLMAFGRTSGIATGGSPLIGFAEPGTGGEAFIARNAPASRSLAIANTAAGWHGGMVVPKAATAPASAGRLQLVASGGPRSSNDVYLRTVEDGIRTGRLKLKVSPNSSAVVVG